MATTKIGIIFGMENTFPGAFVDKVNSMGQRDLQAEFVKIGGARMAEPSVSDELGRGFSVRRVPSLSQTDQRRRMARCLSRPHAGGLLPRLRSYARSLHDTAARGELPGILPLLCGGAGEGPHHAV